MHPISKALLGRRTRGVVTAFNKRTGTSKQSGKAFVMYETTITTPDGSVFTHTQFGNPANERETNDGKPVLFPDFGDAVEVIERQAFDRERPGVKVVQQLNGEILLFRPDPEPVPVASGKK